MPFIEIVIFLTFSNNKWSICYRVYHFDNFFSSKTFIFCTKKFENSTNTNQTTYFHINNLSIFLNFRTFSLNLTSRHCIIFPQFYNHVQLYKFHYIIFAFFVYYFPIAFFTLSILTLICSYIDSLSLYGLI